MAELKFATMMLLPAAVLILLSVSTAAEEVKRCYWCGPLAEQVHRSQRAPSCGQELQETMCDKGYTHCAVVATSPPYAESRLCVKFYQDECYSLYCNSSKTWRMICPCQGNLCNGKNTDRESKAFATLAKIVDKNKRSKRGLVDAKGFIPLTPRKMVLNENNITMYSDNSTTPRATQSDELTDELIEMMQTTSVMDDVDEEHNSENDMEAIIEENTKVEQNSESEMQADQPIELNDSVATTEDVSKNVENTPNNEHSKTTIDDIKMNSVTPTMAMLEVNNDDKPTVFIPVEFIKETQQTTEMPTLTSMIPTSIEIELSVIHIQNPTDNLPPPEALQQNVTPAKENAPTTMGTTEMSTNRNQLETTPTHSTEQTTTDNDQTQETKKKNDQEMDEMDEKNGEEQTIDLLCDIVLILNLLIYITL